MFYYSPIIFALEFITSYLLNSGALAIIGRKIIRTSMLSTLTNVCTWVTFYIIVKIGDWNILLIIAASLGDILADILVAGRLPKVVWRFLNPPKKPVKKPKLPAGITTA